MDIQNELQNLHREKQEKYAYYLISLCIASIAYSINLTNNLKINLNQIPLGCALISWGFSVYYGLKGIEKSLTFLGLNIDLIEIGKGANEIANSNEERIKIIIELTEERLKKLSKLRIKMGNMQFKLFIIGVVLFLIWRILTMIV